MGVGASEPPRQARDTGVGVQWGDGAPAGEGAPSEEAACGTDSEPN